MRASDAIVGRDKVVSRFGRWPTFHDAEVLSVELTRDRDQVLPEGTPPACTVVIRSIGELVNSPHGSVVVTLRFGEVWDASLSQWGHQNPILELQIDLGSDPASPRFDVAFVPVGKGAFQLHIKCDSIEVLSVEATA